MLLLNSPTHIIRPNLREMVWHYARGRFPNYLNDDYGPVGWVKYTHRGIQRLDKIAFPRKQKRYIFSPRFEFRVDSAFDDVVRNCADKSREGKSWITPELIIGYGEMHRAGRAHSIEAWENGRLVGGGFGIHIGGFISVESLFRLVDNASKFAYGQALLHFRKRGFELVDTCCVAEHMVNYGEEWVRQWQFDQMIRKLMRQRVSVADDRPCPPLPVALGLSLEAARVGLALDRRIRRTLGVKERPLTLNDPNAAHENAVPVGGATPRPA